MKPDYYCKEREVFTMAFAKKTWKDRIAEFPTRRRLTKEDNTSELVTVAREEGTLSQEGDAFSAENMNDLESRIDVEFTELNGNLKNTSKLFVPFVNKKSVYFYYTDKAYGYGTFLAMDNYGVLDFYILRNVFDNVTSSGVQVLPSKSLGTNSSVAYIHYRNGKYDFQIVFTSEYSHGMVVVGGGSIMNYSEILQE
jgi:hypothetical protein